MAQATQEQKRTDKSANRPVHTVRYGTIRAAIWKNVAANGNKLHEVYNVTFSRGYHDGKQWRDSGSFGVDDLLVLGKAANDAHTWIHRQHSSPVREDTAGSTGTSAA